MTTAELNQAKRNARHHVWDALEHAGAAPAGVHGHIPDFAGADQAAARLAGLPAWQAASVIKCNPDRAQLGVRVRALREGKLLYMAVPNLATPDPFYLLDPAHLDEPFGEIATSGGAARAGIPTIGVERMRPVDLIVCGSVAVNHHGVRVGKGAGYSDIEVALLAEAGLIGPHTTIATTVHPLQIVEDDLPATGHDFTVDLIVTPDEIITCPASQRPTGIAPEDLTSEKVQAIPVLAARLR